MELCLKFPLLETTYLNEDNNKKMSEVSFLKSLFTSQAYFNSVYFEDVQTLPDTLYKVLIPEQNGSIFNVFKYSKAVLFVHFGVVINVLFKIDENETTFNI